MAIDKEQRDMNSSERKVVLASSLGTIFEWYDFYLFGALATIISRQFFNSLDPSEAFLTALLTFGAGFVVRPLGALFFGRLGDMIGRKYTFLVTILIMGLSTFIVGLLPNYQSIGVAAPLILIYLRLMQGFAMGGEYGGAATYVAEHAPQNKRGAYTGWIQTTASLGLLLSLGVIGGSRALVGEAEFEAWGWRIPFLFSILLLGLSVYVRLSLQESPAFVRMKAQGTLSQAPVKESLRQWKHLRLVLIALLGLTIGQAVIWYTGQFYALFFLTQALRVDEATANMLMAMALVIGTPFFVLFGAWSDKVGRKPIIMLGCLLAAVTYFQVFNGLTRYANPELHAAQARHHVRLEADSDECAFQFNPTGVAKFSSSCDVASHALANSAVSYVHQAGAAGMTAVIHIGDRQVASFSPQGLSAEESKAKAETFKQTLTESLVQAGYPTQANPDKIDRVRVVALLSYLMVLVAMVYGPLAAALVELFPTRIRYTALSLPYHIGNGWFGGLLPTSAFAIVAYNGNMYSGLWYPVILAGATFVIGMLFLKETKHIDIYAQD